MTAEDVPGAIESSLAVQGRKQAVIEPSAHPRPDPAAVGHFDVLWGRNTRRARTPRCWPVRECGTWHDTINGADIVVEASRLLEPAAPLRTEWTKPGASVTP